MTSRVVAAFRGSGGLNAGTPGGDRLRRRSGPQRRTRRRAEQDDRHRAGRVGRGRDDLGAAWTVLAQDDDPVRPDGDHRAAR